MEHSIRVRSVRDGVEWLVPLRAGEQQVQVATLKRRMLEQQRTDTAATAMPRRNRVRAHSDERKSDDSECDDNDAAKHTNGDCKPIDDESAGDSFVMFRGRILADMDFFNVHALTPTDFFVFAQDPPTDDDDIRSNSHGSDDNGSSSYECSNQPQQARPAATSNRKRKRTDATLSAQQQQLAQQLVAMGFELALAQHTLQLCSDDLAAAVAMLTGDTTATATATQSSAASHADRLVRTHPALQPLASALPALLDAQLHGDPFNAIVRVKQLVPNETLATLVAHPVAALQLLRLQLLPTTAAAAANTPVHGASECGPIDVTDDPHCADAIVDADASFDHDVDVIERLASMGFERDLVVAMYESCSKHEEAALNALCEMLQ